MPSSECHRTLSIKVIIGSGNGLVPDGTKPLPETVKTNTIDADVPPGLSELNNLS